MAFVCWNRYLDIAEAVDEGTSLLENADFENSDVPYDILMPFENMQVNFVI